MIPKISAVLIVFLTIAISSCQKETSTKKSGVLVASEQTFTNPLLPSGPDPWAIYHEGNYYYIRSENRKIFLSKTPDITSLKTAESHVVWTAPEMGDHSRNIWAPEIHNIDGKWYIYVAADDGDNRNHRMFVLENTTADPFSGEFTVKSKLATDKNGNWAIDGSIFSHKNQFYFVWSGWEEPKKVGGEETQNIYIAKMSNPWTISSDRVLISTPELDWERQWQFPGSAGPSNRVNVNEGPQMISHGNKIHLVYSASGCWTPFYALGLLTADIDADLMKKSSWTKSPEPVFKQSLENKVYGSGHNSFFKSPDGTEDWILYHATDKATDGCSPKRSPRAQQFTWTKGDVPVFGVPVSTSTKLKKPSGG